MADIIQNNREKTQQQSIESSIVNKINHNPSVTVFASNIRTLVDNVSKSIGKSTAVLSLSISQPTKQSFTKITYSPKSTNSHTSIPNTINSTPAKETRQPQTTPKVKSTNHKSMKIEATTSTNNPSLSTFEKTNSQFTTHTRQAIQNFPYNDPRGNPTKIITGSATGTYSRSYTTSSTSSHGKYEYIFIRKSTLKLYW
ncbi:3297_t:CDS:2, partial [Ambispora leptoticha]